MSSISICLFDAMSTAAELFQNIFILIGLSFMLRHTLIQVFMYTGVHVILKLKFSLYFDIHLPHLTRIFATFNGSGATSCLTVTLYKNII